MQANVTRTGARAFVEQLKTAGVSWIFGNPGTTEYAVLDALGETEGIDLVLALHEGVAVSAAAGYARASGRAAVVQLHAGPGLGNGLGMLYNAWAGQTPLVVYVGQSDQFALYQEPTLSADIVSLVGPISKWAYEVRSADEIPQVLRRALKVAETPPYGPVVLSVPMDLVEQPCNSSIEPPSYVSTAVRPDPEAVARGAELLLRAEAPVVIAGDGIATAGATGELSEIATLLGAPIFGGSLSEVCTEVDEPLWAGRLPFDGALVAKLFAPYDVVLAVGTKVLPQIFPLPGPPLGTRRVVHVGLDTWELAKTQPSAVIFGGERLTLEELTRAVSSRLDDPTRRAWRERAQRVAASLKERSRAARAHDAEAWEDRPISPARAVWELAKGLPDGVTLVDESITAYNAVARTLRLPPGHWFRGRGGGIGEGMGMSVGVQLARPRADIVALVADGSAMYSFTAIWTAAHHRLPVTWVILNNRSYRILKENAIRRRAPAAIDLPFVGADLLDPEIAFVSLAQGMGVSAVRVTEPDAIVDAIRGAIELKEPALIEIVVDGGTDNGAARRAPTQLATRG